MIPDHLIIRSFLGNRTFQDQTGDSLSSYYPITPGVPQGSDISPDFFNIFTSDIPNSNLTKYVSHICRRYGHTAIQASDDDPIIASNALQNNLYEIDLWASKWKIK